MSKPPTRTSIPVSPFKSASDPIAEVAASINARSQFKGKGPASELDAPFIPFGVLRQTIKANRAWISCGRPEVPPRDPVELMGDLFQSSMMTVPQAMVGTDEGTKFSSSSNRCFKYSILSFLVFSFEHFLHFSELTFPLSFVTVARGCVHPSLFKDGEEGDIGGDFFLCRDEQPDISGQF